MRNWLRQQLLCPLCLQNRQSEHGMCDQCWTNIPWYLSQKNYDQLTVDICCFYDTPIKQLIQGLKYRQQLQYLAPLQACFSRIKYKEQFDAIIAMPMSLQKLRIRGFNQSLLLARGLAKQYQCPIWQPIIRGHAHAQQGLNRAERLSNVEDSFSICKTLKSNDIAKRVLLIDDVVTTGASLNALTQQLLLLGCQHIKAKVIAAHL